MWRLLTTFIACPVSLAVFTTSIASYYSVYIVPSPTLGTPGSKSTWLVCFAPSRQVSFPTAEPSLLSDLNLTLCLFFFLHRHASNLYLSVRLNIHIVALHRTCET